MVFRIRSRKLADRENEVAVVQAGGEPPGPVLAIAGAGRPGDGGIGGQSGAVLALPLGKGEGAAACFISVRAVSIEAVGPSMCARACSTRKAE